MSTVNNGTQTINWKYKTSLKGSNLAKMFNGNVPPGIYLNNGILITPGTGLVTSFTGNQITINPFEAIFKASSTQTVHIGTATAIALSTDAGLGYILTTAPYITMSYTWNDQVVNYIDFAFKAFGDITTYDVVIGKAVFTGPNVTSIDYTEATYPPSYNHQTQTFNIYQKLTVGNTTKVTNLNADQVDGADLSTDATLAGDSDDLFPSVKAMLTQLQFPNKVAKTSSYAITDSDNVFDIDVDTTGGDVTITMPLIANNAGRRIRIANVKGGTNKVIVASHATDATKLTGDDLAEVWLPKVGDYIVLQHSPTSGFWEVIDENVSCKFMVDGYAGYGSTDNKIVRLTNVTETYGNLISENHSSGYSSNAKGLEVTINKSGIYSILFRGTPASICAMGISKNSNQLTTSVISITLAHRISHATPYQTYGGVIPFIGWLSKGDVIRPHNESAVALGAVAAFQIEYIS